MRFLKRKWRSITIILLSIILVIPGIFYIYTLDYYRALPIATETLNSDNVENDIQNKMIVFRPQESASGKGIIFYPGGKVDYLAYAPLMEQIAQEGYTCFLMKMSFNLAVFNQEAANKPIEKYKKIDSWYMSGHSLGGAMASIYASKHQGQIDGLILLGAYPAVDLSSSNMGMLSIYGSEDLILSKDKVEKNRSYGPTDSTYFEIKGGNHAYYGSYGNQKKDGKVIITDTEQQEITVREIVKFMKEDMEEHKKLEK